MRIPLKIVPTEIVQAYSLDSLVDDQGLVYTRIEKGMYDLKQAEIIANQELVKYMAPYGCHLAKHTSGLWTNDTRNTLFSLVVDDFCVQYTEEDAKHFLDALRDKYPITVNIEANLYIGIQFEWDYKITNSNIFNYRLCAQDPPQIQTHPPTKPRIFPTHTYGPQLWPEGTIC